MPHVDGFEMIRTLMDDLSVRPRGVIAVSTLSRQETLGIGTLLPEVEFFAKPFQQDRFVRALRSST
jgi:CheY-like chemotaxis protein